MSASTHRFDNVTYIYQKACLAHCYEISSVWDQKIRSVIVDEVIIQNGVVLRSYILWNREFKNPTFCAVLRETLPRRTHVKQGISRHLAFPWCHSKVSRHP
jgi:hypothetical protein